MAPSAATVTAIMIALMSTFCFAQCRALSSSSTQEADYLYWEEKVPESVSQGSKKEDETVLARPNG
jgi:hypothetical protein